MENIHQPLDSSLTYRPEKDLELTEEVATHWVSTGSWALFFALLLSLAGGVLVVVALISLSRSFSTALVMFGVSLLLLTPSTLLWQFQTKLKKALYEESADILEHAFRSMRNLYILMGVLTIAITTLYLIALANTYYQLQNHSYIEESPSF